MSNSANYLSKPSTAGSRLLLAAVLVLTLVTAATPAGAEMPDPESGSEPQLTPVSPEFLAYLEEPSAAPYGYIPPSFDLSHIDEVAIEGFAAESLPSRFDWRDDDQVTPVKNQNPCGMCWAFGTTSVLESAVLIDEETTHDFAEQSVGLCVDRSWTSLYDAWDDPCNAGGNPFHASEVFIKKGAVSETCNTYDPPALQCNGECVCDSCPAVKMVEGVRWVTNDGSQIAKIKNAVYDEGPVTVSYFHDDAYVYSDATWGTIYDYYPASEEPNHLVSIVGWDDDVPHPDPDHDGAGAWIVKNSWGTGWGDNGYFYLAYDSSNAKGVVYFHYKDPDPGEELLFWDEAGPVGAVGYGNTTAWMASVFTAPEDMAVTHVDFWTTSSNAEYEIYVWDGLFGSQLAHQIGSCQVMGYYSVPLSTSVVIPGGQEFTVGVKMTTPGFNHPIPVEYQISDSVDPPIQSGVSFVRPSAADSWDDLAGDGGNVSLRARMEAVATTSRTWNGSINSDWHTAGNWTPSGVPSSSEDVTIPDVANDPIISGDDAAVDSLTIEAGAVLDLTNRTLTVEGTLTNNGTLRQTRGVAAGSTTDFLRITNAAGTQTKYYGVEITPSTVGGSASLPGPPASQSLDIRRKLQSRRVFNGEESGTDEWLHHQASESAKSEGPPVEGQDQETVYPDADATVLQGVPSTNFGTTSDMWVGYENCSDASDGVARSLVQFDLFGIPPGASVQAASLYVYLVNSCDMGERTHEVRVYRSSASWSETSVTWNGQPDFEESYDASWIPSQTWDWYSFDVTDLVRGWLDGSFSNQGLMLRGPESSGTDGARLGFFTKEGGYAPELVVDYAASDTPPDPPSDPTPADGATDQSVDVDLSWTGGDPDPDDTVTYDVHLDAEDPTPTTLVCEDATTPSCDPGTLDPGTQYFWYVVATDNHGASTTSDTWAFTTETGGTDVTVSVSGDQFCADRDTGVKRCFDVAPQAQMDATVRFYFREAERYELALDDLLVLHYVGEWTEEAGPYTRGGAGDVEFVEAENVRDFSPFALDMAAESPNSPPYEPGNPSPTDGATGVSSDVQLSWTGGDPDSGDSVTYDVYLEADATPGVLVCEDALTPACDPSTLAEGTEYFWYVEATDSIDASTTGPTWSFTTEETVRTVYLPAVVKAYPIAPLSGPKPGLWAGEGLEFYVTEDRASVDDFAIYISVEGCGDYKIMHDPPEPIENDEFSFSGPFYASGTLHSETTASDTTGLDEYHIPECGTLTGGPFPWDATWQNSSQPTGLSPRIEGLNLRESGTRAGLHRITHVE